MPNRWLDIQCSQFYRTRSSETYNIIHPFLERKRACAMTSLYNLAELQWKTISCKEKLFYYMVCTKQELVGVTLTINMKSEMKCLSTSIVINQKCFTFQWKSKGEKVNSNIISNIISTKYLKKFHDFFYTLLLEKSNIVILTKVGSNLLNSVWVTKYYNSLDYKLNNISFTNAQGWLTLKMQKSRIIHGTYMFKCKKGSFIISDLVCNNFTDCPYDESDEEYCTCKENVKVKYCKHIERGQTIKVCHHFYYTTLSGNCYKYNNVNAIWQDFQIKLMKVDTESNSKIEERTNFRESSKNHQEIFDQEYFNFNSGKVIAKILYDDMVSDCGPDAEDEPLLKLLLYKTIYYSCERPDERPYMVGHKRCYKITDTCVYILSQYNILIPCRNGAHLQICSNFECNMMFKCSNAYCIPWSYVCNGKWDCPEGYDEVQNMCNKICNNMF